MKKLISLTFDDGPNKDPADHTMEKMLDILEKYNIKASFFLIGSKITEENTAVIERAFKMGCDMENHSWSHPAFSGLTPEQMQEEYKKCDEAITKITGVKPEYFRAPFIAVSDTVFETIKTPFICGHGATDWDPAYDTEYRYNEIMNSATDGLIYLFHVMEGNTPTLEAWDRAIPELLKQDYEFVTVPELFKRKGINPARPNHQWTNVLD